MWQSTNKRLGFICLILTVIIVGIAGYAQYREKHPINLTQQASNKISYPQFTCALEKDHNPALDPEAEKYYQEARRLEKIPGIRNWPAIVENYNKAIERNHWKAMNNLAAHYRTGERSIAGKPGIAKNIDNMLALHEQMLELEVPLGYYNWAVDIERGYLKGGEAKDASYYMFEAAQKGNPMAQVRLGNFFAFELPKGEQRDDIADQYFRCAGKQNNTEALSEVADFYEIAKKNKPLSAFYYQKAASLGSNIGMMYLANIFEEKPTALFDFGYEPNKKLDKFYKNLWAELGANPDLKFPNLLKDHPLPRHPSQGYDVENPDVRPE